MSSDDPGLEVATVRRPGSGCEEVPAPEVFELLSDETRYGIVRTLAAGERLRFSALRERVGTDDSGQFNYHLERLRGRLVRKAEGGYELTRTGRAYADVVAGSDRR